MIEEVVSQMMVALANHYLAYDFHYLKVIYYSKS